MRFLAMALVLVLAIACCCCAIMASDRRSIEAKIMHGKSKQVSSQNDHHSIPRKDYGNPGPGHFDVTDDNDHHYIPRKDFGKPGSDSAQFYVTNDDDHHHFPNRDYGKPGGATRAVNNDPGDFPHKNYGN